MKKSPVEAHELIQILLTSLYEIIGSAEMETMIETISLPINFDEEAPVLNHLFSLSDWENMAGQLKLLYGEESTCGIAIRTGQEFFTGYFRRFGSDTSMNEPDFRMLPKPRRIQKGLEILANLYQHAIPQLEVQIIQDEDHWYWKTADSKNWFVKRGIEPLFQNFTLGVIQEFLSWTSGGKAYPVHLVTGIQETGTDMRTIQIKKHYLS